jgi:hypothetical protein
MLKDVDFNVVILLPTKYTHQQKVALRLEWPHPGL